MTEDTGDKEEKESYHKVDKRTWLHQEEASSGSEQPAEAAGEPAAAEGEAQPELSEEAEKGEQPAEAEGPMVELDTYGLLRMCLGMFVEQAWVQMGVRLAPGAKEIKTDLAQAKLAIDTVNYIKQSLAGGLTAEEKREVEQLLATLRMNYVQRV